MHINYKRNIFYRFIRQLIDLFVILYFIIFKLILSIFRQKKKYKGIIILRLDALGDLFLWLSSANEIRKKYRGQHITLVCKEEYLEFLTSLNLFNILIPINLNKFFKNPIYHFHTINRISKQSYDLLLSPMYSRAIKCDLLAKLIFAKEKIGCFGDNSSIRKFTKVITNNWYSELVSSNSSPNTIHEIFSNFHFLNHIGIQELPNIFSLRSKYNSKFNFSTKYFVLFPGSSNKFRNWDIGKFSDSVEFIYKKYSFLPVICGGVSEIDISKKLIELNKSIKYISLVNSTSILDLVDIIAKAELVITNETAATHIAASVNTLCFTVLGGGHFGRFAPYPKTLNQNQNRVIFNKLECFNCNWYCSIIKKNELTYPCINKISSSNLISQIDKELNKKNYL